MKFTVLRVALWLLGIRVRYQVRIFRPSVKVRLDGLLVNPNNQSYKAATARLSSLNLKPGEQAKIIMRATLAHRFEPVQSADVVSLPAKGKAA